MQLDTEKAGFGFTCFNFHHKSTMNQAEEATLLSKRARILYQIYAISELYLRVIGKSIMKGA